MMHLLGILALCLKIVYCSASVVNPGKSIPFRVEYINDQEFQSLINNPTLLEQGRIFSLYEGSDIACYQGNKTSILSNFDVENGLNHIDSEYFMNAVDVVNEALNPVRTFWSLSDYWHYSFASNESRSVTQCHKDNEYVLGKSLNYNSSTDFAIGTDYHGRPYINETLIDGDICDLTGQPREIKIRYFCSSLARGWGDYEFREVQTCKYVLDVYLTGLCGIPFLNPTLDRFSENTVLCHRPEGTLSPFFEILNRYTTKMLGRSIYLLSPKDEGKDRKQLMYRISGSVDAKFDTQRPSVEDKFIKDFIVSLKKLVGMNFIKSPTGDPIAPGDLFLWRAPVIDEAGEFLFFVDLELNPASEAIAIINNNRTLIEDLPLHNMVHFESAAARQQVLQLKSSASVQSTHSLPNVFDKSEEMKIENDRDAAKDFAVALKEAFREMGYPEMQVEVGQLVVD
ncbi:unnamed protein product [Kluyveromyces dobzhanskii CBS 2104]|uniref:Endoplasmic reticulum lectin n=1 Tax=Kluyveromyces dobzhanskii CBS 2104 TaxID=1427455 RepID=A0A0A8L2W2_9SACH|nr:unnamed protein product [Kluyveromyces dobzhanskii CBS 2104]